MPVTGSMPWQVADGRDRDRFVQESQYDEGFFERMFDAKREVD